MDPEDDGDAQEEGWVSPAGEVCTVGVTAYAAGQLGDVTYVELPELGAVLAKGAEAATVESVKAASDIYAPAAGEVSEVNTARNEQPELVNESPYGEGWFFKLSHVDSADLDGMMDAGAYAHYVEEQSQ